jgi:hypothetical protein
MSINWTRDQLFPALRLYFETPFGKLHRGNPEIIALAQRIGRTPSAVAMKLSNFASIDPDIRQSGRNGLGNASHADRAAWAEFTGDWNAAVAMTEQPLRPEPTRTEVEALLKRRLGQDFFRRAVLGNFNNCCCATGVTEARLLVASHIVPWADDEANRLNPANGLCLAATHDRAFDAGLITLDPEWRWRVSNDLLGQTSPETRALFEPLVKKPIRNPSNISLSAALAARHREAALNRHDYS